MADEAALPTRLDAAQVGKAVNALMTYVENRGKGDGDKDGLFADDDGEFISIIFGLKRTPLRAKKTHRIALPSPMWADTDNVDVCLIVKDPQDEWEEAVEACGADVALVLSVSQLRKNYKQFEARRKLLGSFDLFVADSAVVPILPKLLGNKFFKKKKVPIKAKLTKTNVKKEVERIKSETFMRISGGPCINVKVATTAHTREQVGMNVLAAVAQVAHLVPRRWNNIQSINIKTTDSVALPIYNAIPMPNSVAGGAPSTSATAAAAEETPATATAPAPAPAPKKRRKKKSTNKKGKAAAAPAKAASPVAAAAAPATPDSEGRPAQRRSRKRRRSRVQAEEAASPEAPAAAPEPTPVADTPGLRRSKRQRKSVKRGD